jgi:hypothetical protein
MAELTRSVLNMYSESGRGLDETEKRAYIKGFPTEYLLQEVIRRHEEINRLFESSLNDGVVDRLNYCNEEMKNLEEQTRQIMSVVAKVRGEIKYGL